MIPLAVLDILADDWVRSRQDSARKYGTRESTVVGWYGALRARLSHPAPAPAPTTTAANPPSASPRRAA